MKIYKAKNQKTCEEVKGELYYIDQINPFKHQAYIKSGTTHTPVDCTSIILVEGDAVEKEPGNIWKPFSHTSALADTGDYMSEVGIENGKMTMFCSNDEIEISELQEICNKLNRSPKDPFENFESQATKENIQWHGRLEEFEGEKKEDFKNKFTELFGGVIDFSKRTQLEWIFSYFNK